MDDLVVADDVDDILLPSFFLDGESEVLLRRLGCPDDGAEKRKLAAKQV